MLYTAAILVCMSGIPQSYESCQVVNANFKYRSEEQCWAAINGWVKWQNDKIEATNHYILSAKCINWFENIDSKKEKL